VAVVWATRLVVQGRGLLSLSSMRCSAAGSKTEWPHCAPAAVWAHQCWFIWANNITNRPAPLLEKLVQITASRDLTLSVRAGNFGRKTGKGVFDYSK
jgi:hypothetical protein